MVINRNSQTAAFFRRKRDGITWHPGPGDLHRAVTWIRNGWCLCHWAGKWNVALDWLAGLAVVRLGGVQFAALWCVRFRNFGLEITVFVHRHGHWVAIFWCDGYFTTWFTLPANGHVAINWLANFDFWFSWCVVRRGDGCWVGGPALAVLGDICVCTWCKHAVWNHGAEVAILIDRHGHRTAAILWGHGNGAAWGALTTDDGTARSFLGSHVGWLSWLSVRHFASTCRAVHAVLVLGCRQG